MNTQMQTFNIFLIYVIGTSWMCKRCTESEPYRLRKSDSKQKTVKSTTSSHNENHVATSSVKVLPYDVSLSTVYVWKL